MPGVLCQGGPVDAPHDWGLEERGGHKCRSCGVWRWTDGKVMRPSFEEINMRYAELLAQRSTCARLQVGCVIASVDFRKVLAVGYNGNASGLPNRCDSTTPGACGCFVSGTRVFPRGVTRAYRRRYEGEVVKVVTAAGEFTGTPNHPVLAYGRGWTPLNLLHKGDRLLNTFGDQQFFGRTPNYQDGVPIEEVFEALLVTSGVVRRTGTSHDFHGDGVVYEGVDIVRADGSLSTNLKPSRFERRSQPLFSAALMIAPALGCTCRGETVVPTSITNAAAFRSALLTKQSTSLDQTEVDGLLADTKRLREGFGRFTSQIASDDFVDRQVDHVLPFMPAEILGHFSKGAGSTKPLLDGGVRHPERIGDGEYGLAPLVSAYKVLHVERYRWSGHVYNLETETNWYSLQPGGIIAHNCLHAEDNAVINCDSPRSMQKIVFCTHQPCKMCAKRFVNLGNVVKVYYVEDYRLREGLDVLDGAGIRYARLQVLS